MRPPSIHSHPRGTAWCDHAYVVAAALAVLGLAYATGSPGLRWSDEFVYAVVGRNLAEGRGFISNFYNPDAILAKGFPLYLAHHLTVPPRVLIAPKAYRYGWEAYPVAIVVWDATDLRRVRALDYASPSMPMSCGRKSGSVSSGAGQRSVSGRVPAC